MDKIRITLQYIHRKYIGDPKKGPRIIMTQETIHRVTIRKAETT